MLFYEVKTLFLRIMFTFIEMFEERLYYEVLVVHGKVAC